jgi:hypothetical protein
MIKNENVEPDRVDNSTLLYKSKVNIAAYQRHESNWKFPSSPETLIPHPIGCHVQNIMDCKIDINSVSIENSDVVISQIGLL